MERRFTAFGAMRELDYDLTTHSSKSLNEIAAGEYAAVTIGCGDSCLNVSARIREDWQIHDPREMPPGQFRDLIEIKVQELPARRA